MIWLLRGFGSILARIGQQRKEISNQAAGLSVGILSS